MKSINVILCGGSGTRLWPLSRKNYPKQFIQIFKGQSLFQKTLLRNAKLVDRVAVVVGPSSLFHAVNQVEELGLKDRVSFLVEPVAKNTLPAILLAALEFPNDCLWVTTSDHIIEDGGEYKSSLKEAISLAQKNKLVTFGVKPTSPHTGYGYIKYKDREILEFKEKPELKIAESYLSSGDYLWNSGMFVFLSSLLLEEANNLQPDVYESCLAAYKNKSEEGVVKHLPEDKFSKSPGISIDYGIMEATDKGVVIPVGYLWKDLGSFDSLADYSSSDETANFSSSRDAHFYNNSSGNYFYTDKVVVTSGVEDLVVVDHQDVLFVTKKGRSEDLRGIVKNIEADQPELLKESVTEHRPWGSFTSVVDKSECKVKTIEVYPGRKLSLQKHSKRSEHWIVVAGEPKVTVGKSVKKYKVSDHIFIPIGEVHRLENDTNELVKIIEVQIGTYLGEDDITRLEDDFNRK